MKFIKKESNVSPSFLTECCKIFNITPQIMEQIIQRGNDTVEKITEFLKPTQKSFHNPFDLKNMQALVDRIKKAVNKKERILIFGDYDVDGVSATAIMIKTLKIMGANPKFYLPNRYVDGYGLTNDVIDKIKEVFNPQLIITVDCGISCYQEVEYAKTKGIEVVVTDHHEIPEIIPNTIVVNAKLPNQKYAFNGLCGTGLAYKIATALIGQKAEDLLSIACLATVADIVPLVDENRAIVYFGLKQFERLPLGLRMLFKKLGINVNKATSSDISYKIAPKLNASGRMGDAKDSLKLYLSENVEELTKYIDKILTHNNNRRELCDIVEQDCRNILSKLNIVGPSIILSSSNWDHGILGIICAKLSNEYNRPVFLFSEVDGEMHGSARSIPGVNIHVLLSSMEDILETFGGHPVAAGLTIKSENFNEFIKRVNSYLLNHFSQDVFLPKDYYDIEIKLEDLTPKFVKDLAKLEPCGCDNELPKLYIKTKNYEITPMKNYYEHCNIKLGNTLNLVYFNCDSEYLKYNNASSLNIVFEIQLENNYSRSLKGVIKNIDCEYGDIKNVGKLPVIPYLEQLKYISENNNAKFQIVSLKKENFVLNDNFGTAVVINSDIGYRRAEKVLDLSKFSKIDVCNGKENSGHNVIVFSPENIEFAKFYKKIIFFDFVAETSYIGKINKISDAEIIIVKDSLNYSFFANFDLSYENVGKIYKDLISSKTNFASFLELYFNLKNKKSVTYSYKEMYAAILIFQELNLLTIYEVKHKKSLRFDRSVKTELNKSKIYNAINNLKNKKTKF